MSSPYIQSFSLDASTRNQILGELRRWRFDSTLVALRHLAYAVPSGMRFSLSDCQQILDELEFDTQFINTALAQLERDGMLLRKFDGTLGASVYHLERRAREEYREALKKFDHEPEPEKRDVSKELQEMASRVTDPHESVFLDEVMKCVAVDAPRAAIVMAWNLGYHHVRSWILTRHMPAFNAELTSRLRSKTKTYDPVSSHEDFPDSEWFVLDVCRAAGFLDRHRFGVLDGALKKRNRYAHPSPAKASGPEATGYIAELLKNVVLEPYFN